MNPEAEIAWTAELHRRQRAHTLEVWRLLNAWPRDAAVTLLYGPGREVTGAIEQLDRDRASQDVDPGGGARAASQRKRVQASSETAR